MEAEAASGAQTIFMTKVTITFGDEIQPALQEHLDGSLAVQTYVRAALRFFNEVLKREREGKAVGYGERNRFSTYNTELSPGQYLLTKPAD